MRRSVPKVGDLKASPFSPFLKWHRCSECGYDFKREQGVKVFMFVHDFCGDDWELLAKYCNECSSGDVERAKDLFTVSRSVKKL